MTPLTTQAHTASVVFVGRVSNPGAHHALRRVTCRCAWRNVSWSACRCVVCVCRVWWWYCAKHRRMLRHGVATSFAVELTRPRIYEVLQVSKSYTCKIPPSPPQQPSPERNEAGALRQSAISPWFAIFTRHHDWPSRSGLESSVHPRKIP